MGKSRIFVSLAVLLLAYFYYGKGKYREGVTVQTNSGLVKGSMYTSRDGRDFYQWLAIPYAEPPVGQLRFASPKPVKNWDGVRDGSRYGPSCPQSDMITLMMVGEEDCLHLNIYAPKVGNKRKEKQLLPVMVYIHGGGFIMGSGKEYGPDYFMDEDVVYVNLNYRYGVLGFASTGDQKIRGNMGLKDQAEALRWINANIQFFGGDPNKVTIFGESAGGVSVHYLTLSSKTKGLFQKAISLSGTAISPWGFAPLKTIVRKTESFAEKLNCPIDNSTAIVECLRKLEVSQIVEAFKKDSTEFYMAHPSKDGQNFPPTAEAVSDEESFLNHKPYDIMLQGQGHNIPWMTGGLKDEGLIQAWEFYREEEAMNIVENNWDEKMKSMLSFSTTFSPTIAKQATKKLREFYFTPPRAQNELTVEEKKQRYTQLFSDAMFLIGLSESANIQREFSSVYLFYFDRPGGPSLFADFMLNVKNPRPVWRIVETICFFAKNAVYKFFKVPSVDLGVGHASDLGFLFPLKGLEYLPKDEGDADYRFSKDFVRLLVSFAVDDKSMEFRNTKFLPTEAEGPLTYLNINEKPKVIPEPFAERTEFWQSINYAKLFSNLR